MRDPRDHDSSSSSSSDSSSDDSDSSLGLQPNKDVSIVLNRKLRVDPEWTFDIDYLQKIRHFKVRHDGTVVPMTESYKRAHELRLARYCYTKWRYFVRVRRRLAAINVTPSKRSKDTECSGMLPHWCLFIPWFMVVSLSMSCAFFTILYSFNYSTGDSLEWLRSWTISFVVDVVVLQPLAILAATMYLTFIARANEIDRLEVEVDVEEDIDANDRFLIAAERQAITLFKSMAAVYRHLPRVS